MPFDDDIKIFTLKSERKKEEKPTVVFEEGDTSLFTHNALTLGSRLVERMLKSKQDKMFDQLGDGSSHLQVTLLLAFTICSTLEKKCLTPQLANTALNSFYNTLKATDISLYEDLSSSGAFSFYYLAVRHGGDVERRIGQTFAMLCAEDGNDIYKEMGEAMYFNFVNLVETEIDKLGLLKK